MIWWCESQHLKSFSFSAAINLRVLRAYMHTASVIRVNLELAHFLLFEYAWNTLIILLVPFAEVIFFLVVSPKVFSLQLLSPKCTQPVSSSTILLSSLASFNGLAMSFRDRRGQGGSFYYRFQCNLTWQPTTWHNYQHNYQPEVTKFPIWEGRVRRQLPKDPM